MVVAPAARAPVTLAAPLTVSLFEPSNVPPPITAVERSVAPADNVPETTVLPFVPSTVKRFTVGVPDFTAKLPFVIVASPVIFVTPADNVPVVVLPRVAVPPL